MVRRSDKVTAAEFDALLSNANARRQRRIGELRAKVESLEYDNHRVREQITTLRALLNRRLGLERRLEDVLEEARAEDHAIEGEIARVLAAR